MTAVQKAPEEMTPERFSEITDKHRRLALAMLSAEDDGIGRVLDKLREHHLEENYAALRRQYGLG